MHNIPEYTRGRICSSLFPRVANSNRIASIKYKRIENTSSQANAED